MVRLAEREDITTDAGIRFAKSAVEQAPTDVLVVVWAALPCTGGYPRQNINKRMPGGMQILRTRFDIYGTKAQWNDFEQFVEWLSNGPRRWKCCIEWPRNCAFWRRSEVRTCVQPWEQ